MKNSELKQAINDDLATLKNLDLDIMPGKLYYRLNLSLLGKIFFLFYLTALGGCILLHQGLASCMLWIPLFVTTTITFFSLGLINDYIIFNYQIRPKLKTGDLLLKKIKLTVWLFFVFYIIGVWLVSAFFGYISAEPTPTHHTDSVDYSPSFPQWILFIAISSAFPFGGFLVCGLLVQTIIELELKRVGISVLFSVIQKYFNPDEEEKTKHVGWSNR